MTPLPPKWADKLLSFFCKGYLLEEIQGDLYEYYLKQIDARGKLTANLIYWFQVLNFIRPFAIKEREPSNHLTMLKYNILIAFRSLKRQKFYTFINITGLAIALACCLLISIFILDELSYDKHFENNDRIYRASAHIVFNQNDLKYATSPAPMGEALKNDLPEIEEVGRVQNIGPILLEKEDQFIKQRNVAFADNSFLKIFKLKFIYGGGEELLSSPDNMLLSQKAAEKYFGHENPVGKTIKSSSGNVFNVAGVYHDIPRNSHFHFDVMLSMERNPNSKVPNWGSNDFKNYFLLKEGASVDAVNDKLSETLRKYLEPFLQNAAGINYDEFLAGGNFLNYKLIPMTDIHLHSHLQLEMEANGSMSNIYIFGAIGFIILFLACFNFMNLSTAKSTKRAKEVGVRKILGSLRSSLVWQFLTESVIVSFIALIIASVVVNFALPYFNEFTGKNIINPFFGILNLWPYALLGCLVIGFLAGIYPAFILSSFNPVKVLKGTLGAGNRGSLLRNSLVVFQFSISILMIMGTAVVYKQLVYSQNKNLGYDQNKVILIDNTYVIGEGIEALKNELLSQAEITDVTSTQFFPTREARSDYTFIKGEENVAENAINMQTWRIDDTYFSTLGMNVVEGRNFDPSFGTDSAAIVINRTAVKTFGLSDPVGKEIKTVDGKFHYTIIGVIDDFFFESFKEAVKPMAFMYGENTNTTALRYQADDPRELVNRLETIWESHAGGHPFEYAFMDDEFDGRFKEDKKLGTILTLFSTLAIFIACLGLFALASYTAEQKKKEISIRKVLGASVVNIIQLLFSNFSKLLIISTFIAVPLGYFLMNKWLEDFAYRTTIDVMLIIASALAVFVIAWLTVGSQTIKAAKANPADNLYRE